MIKMDPIQEIELAAYCHQNLMNDVIDLGDSPVQQFYSGATVFVTGGSGFSGKQLIEKLFRSNNNCLDNRSCGIKKMYLLLRPKKEKSIQERLNFILVDPVFNLVREKQPEFERKIVPVEGDVACTRLGLKDEVWTKLAKEVNVIFHVEDTVQFDALLRDATFTNVRSTRDSLILARECSNLKSYVYLSTAYVAATNDNIGKVVYEQFYPSPMTPELLISLVEELDEDKLEKISYELIRGWPNTYTFTKAVAEEQIRSSAKDLPVCIVRPPIVVPAYYEPSPGWLDMSAITGVSGIILGIMLGVLHVLHIDKDVKLPVAPVDYINNAVIAAGWDAQERRKAGDKDIPIYTVSNKDYYFSWNYAGKCMRENRNLSTDKAVYLCSLIECRNYYLYRLLTWLFHYIPAYILDGCYIVLRKRPKGIKSFVGLYRMVDKLSQVYEYFMWNHWSFHDDNIRSMLNRMSEADRAIYNCDLSTIDFKEYVLVFGVGIRKYIIKDGLNNTDLGRKKQCVFSLMNFFIIPIYFYFIWSISRLLFSVVKYVIQIFI